MKDVRTFRIDDELKTALEVLITNGLREKLVAQVILKDHLLCIRYEVQNDFDILANKVSNWKAQNRTFTLKSHGKILAFEISCDEIEKIAITNSISEAKAGYIGLEISIYEDKINDILFPRIYLDGKGRLKIRARDHQDAIELMRHLLFWGGNVAPIIERVKEGIGEIVVHHSHDGVKFNRALVKIAVNCLLFCYPNSKMEKEKLLVPIRFARYNEGDVHFVTIHDKCKLDDEPKTHNLFFYNNKNETLIRISLYNGAFIIAFRFPRISAIDLNGSGRLLIKYQNFTNVFQDYKELDDILKI